MKSPPLVSIFCFYIIHKNEVTKLFTVFFRGTLLIKNCDSKFILQLHNFFILLK